LLRRIVITILFLFVPATALRAQDASGGMRGIVQDAAKARIAAAVITMQLAGTSQTRSVTTWIVACDHRCPRIHTRSG
jgi:hypothetical protein